ncbi:MAG: YabP/YqfC family sporulation protein [Clostridia bacterium]|nr:YabP/YqfC family sporulation protein [Clostridia bacterium]
MQNGNSGHTLALTDRSTAAITGVEDVECFNEQIVVLRTPLGALTLSGEGLNISQLNLSDGKLMVEGEITAIEYSRTPRTGKGFFGRLLR